MGKSSKKPSYSGGTINVNGRPVSSTSQSGNYINSNYNMSDAEKNIYDFAQNSFWQNLPNVNIFDEGTQKGIQDQLKAYSNNGKELVNELYTPMIDDLKNDIASRFGNFDNSSFMDSLNKIEDKRSESMSDLSQDILAKQDELYNNELANRYGYLNFLQDIYNNTNNNILNFVNGAQQNSASGNAYNAKNYTNSGGWDDYSTLASNALSFLGPHGQVASSIFNIGKKFL